MKSIVPAGIVILALGGCASLGPLPGSARSPGSARDSAGSSTAVSAYPAQDQNTSPRLIIPADGSAPVIGIPIGGDLYLPVTGGPPVTAVGTSP